jgi:hypothetical protein
MTMMLMMMMMMMPTRKCVRQWRHSSTYF